METLTCDILHSPEVHWQQKDNDDKDDNVAVGEPATQPVGQDGKDAET